MAPTERANVGRSDPTKRRGSSEDSDDVPRSKKAWSESHFVIAETIGTIDNAQDLLIGEVTKKEEGIFGLPIEVRLSNI
jgi:hypothetical protein